MDRYLAWHRNIHLPIVAGIGGKQENTTRDWLMEGPNCKWEICLFLIGHCFGFRPQGRSHKVAQNPHLSPWQMTEAIGVIERD